MRSRAQGTGHASLRLKGEQQGHCLHAELGSERKGLVRWFYTCLCKPLPDVKPCSPRHVSSCSTQTMWSTYHTKKLLSFTGPALQDPRAKACWARSHAPALPATLFYLSCH